MKTSHTIVSLTALTLLAIPTGSVARATADSPQSLQQSAIQQGAGAASAPLLKPAVIRIINEKAKLTALDGESGDWFGVAVSISGNLAIVGAKNDFDNGDYSGSAYIFAFDGTNWNLQAKLLASDGAAFDDFGSSVAISGNVALVGAPSNFSVAQGSGAVYVFTFDGTAWTQQVKLLASDLQEFSNFGSSVALSGDTAIVGATGFDFPGAAYIFTFDGTAWSEQAKLTAADGDDLDDFGNAVSLSGNRALVGADNKGPLGSDYRKGAAYIFSFDGSTWSQEAELTALDAAMDDRFGYAVSLSGDLALVGTPYKTENRGAAYVFAFDGTTWSQQTKLKPAGGRKNDYFGYSVAISGTVALVGAQQILGPGAVYQFSFRRNRWIERAELLASDGMAGDTLGSSVSISGNTVLSGARYGDSENGTNRGAAYTFSLGR